MTNDHLLNNQKILAKAILELSQKAAFVSQFDGEESVLTGIDLESEFELKDIINE